MSPLGKSALLRKLAHRNSVTSVKKHGGAHTTHNTVDCKKYNAGGALKTGFQPRKGKSNRNENLAQIIKDGFAKVTKKASRKEKKRKQNSDSNSS